jgi:hypothetical protein
MIEIRTTGPNNAARPPRWLLSIYYAVLVIAAVVCAAGIYFNRQIPVRGATAPSAERPYHAWKGKSMTKDYYLSGSDFFLCQLLALIGLLGLIGTSLAMVIYSRCVARHPSKIENAAS